ncbi:hypothetical protein LTS07_005186 [Exophiala sideris]|uniref:Xylanolytic transcriptional activator regulatory domain-containing protein n=1 Tax=Exophiala sideris TaxID=1016849 RepID=A0ABR0JAN9_9EURO|nr:hypothetical protein LTS07_005186 [Exophiala sideris]KAK5038455.1 hypothetical protein LTR13_004202 [Exophiala sideris]KAK5060338.1 hypothetical protein LTR69_005655 [Exophiala sideris]KAK5183248.1 hypothetical protein LTR44_004249 [Eurotiomycetes sp. CCFEE 6388]
MASTTSARYFSWTHLWMPIISISKWRTQLTGPLARPRADVKILLFAMKLILWTPQDSETGEPRTEDYFILKDLVLQAEAAGMLSLQLLQALILLTIYEYSHAIYPAAYLSIGTCVRYGLALGIDKQRQVEVDATDFGLDEQEERRRVWWATIILDRMVSWSSTSPEPRSDDLLPVHDQHWDEGRIERSRIEPVSASSNTNMGRVYRWKNYPTGDAKFDEDEKDQLDRALRALLNLIYQEGATRLMPICPQTALCFSALVTLHSQPGNATPFMSHADYAAPMRFPTESQTQNRLSALVETLQFLRPIAEESSVSTALFFRKEPWSIEKSSPLLIHWTYLIAVTFLRLKISLDREEAQTSLFNVSSVVPAVELRKQADRGLDAMKMKLSLLGKQWLAAGAYLRILEAREVANML